MNLAASLAAHWVLRGIKTISTGEEMHERLCDAFRGARPALERTMQVRFIMRIHSMSQESTGVASLFLCLVHLGHAHLVSPADGLLHLDLKKEPAEKILAWLPVQAREILGELAAKVVQTR